MGFWRVVDPDLCWRDVSVLEKRGRSKRVREDGNGSMEIVTYISYAS